MWNIICRFIHFIFNVWLLVSPKYCNDVYCVDREQWSNNKTKINVLRLENIDDETLTIDILFVDSE